MMVVLQKNIVAFEHEPRNELHYADRAQIGMIGETLKNNTGDTIKSLRNHGASDGPFLKRHQMYFYILNGSLLRKNQMKPLHLTDLFFFPTFFVAKVNFARLMDSLVYTTFLMFVSGFGLFLLGGPA